TQPRSHLITNHRWQTQTALITPTSTTKQTPNQTPTDQLSRVMQSRARQSRADYLTRARGPIERTRIRSTN
ncbi:hypothetical protein, partial [Acinetobacter baumannii]|uniref:hypothetical protein n=1 Tax=Acinetobacter baumannii TaxID=470 RepID=UPI003398DAAC